MLGQIQLIAQYARFGEVKGALVTSDTEASGFTLAAKYFLSKRTGVYASFSTIRNKPNAFWDMSNAGFSSMATTFANRGADPRVMAVGVMHNF
jgi:predicted porin